MRFRALAVLALLVGSLGATAQAPELSATVRVFVRVDAPRVVLEADLVVIKGDPSRQISDVEDRELVFKDGVGYDSRISWIR